MVYFNQTVIVFTSNIGASDLTNHNTGETIRPGIMRHINEGNIPPYLDVEKHFDSEVRWYFSNYIGRAELLGRLGDNIIVFDLLRAEFITSIANKFLQQYVEVTKEKYKLSVTFSSSVSERLSLQMQEERNLVLGGRRIKSLLETLVEKPLNSWLFENFPNTNMLMNKTLLVKLNQDDCLIPEISEC
jgi:ATP-dependent Clp protease ATP-binding subunit ClpA